METLKIIIEKSSDYYDAYVDNCAGIYGAGATVEEVKQNVMDGLHLFIKYNKDNLPKILQEEYQIEYQFDVASFLEYYSKIFSKPALEHITGINQKQLFHYASGLRKPSEKTVKKIDNAFRRFAGELNQVHFI